VKCCILNWFSLDVYNCTCLCLCERRSCLLCDFISFYSLKRHKAPCALTRSQCREIVQDPSHPPKKPKPRSLRLLEFLMCFLWFHLWGKKKDVQLKTTLKKERGRGKYAPIMFWRIEITCFLWAVCNKFSLGISYPNCLFLLSNIKNTVTLLTNVSFLC